MPIFTTRRIVKSKTLGEKLKEARAEKGIALDRAAKDLNIAFKYLEALENNELNKLPGRAYFKIFLRRYCQYLDLDFYDSWKSAKGLPSFNPQKNIDLTTRHFRAWSKTTPKIIAAILILAVLVFLIFRVANIFLPPNLTIASPKDNSVVTNRQIQIIGQSEPEVEVVVNNKNIYVDKTGKFQTDLDLSNGLNLIKITAKKRYSRTQEVDIRVLLKE